MNLKEDLDPADPNNPANDGGKPPAKVGEGGDNPEELKSRLANAEAVISDLKEFAGVKSVKEIKEKLKPPAPAPEKAPVQQKEQGEYVTREEIALFGQGYTPDEIEVAKRLAPGKPLTEAVKDETAKAAIAGIRSARKTNDSIPDPENRIPVHQGKSFDQLTPAEKKANYAQSVGKLIGKGQNSRSPGR